MAGTISKTLTGPDRIPGDRAMQLCGFRAADPGTRPGTRLVRNLRMNRTLILLFCAAGATLTACGSDRRVQDATSNSDQESTDPLRASDLSDVQRAINSAALGRGPRRALLGWRHDPRLRADRQR